jgi:signal peptidase II
LLVGCDHATKYLAKAELEHQSSRHVVGSLLELRYVENTDVAFNMLRWIPEGVRGPLLLAFGALSVLLLFAVLWFAVLRGRPGAALTQASIVLILAGALGNYADRLVRGYVVDFIQVPHWPVFNVADVCVSAGAALLAWTTLRRQPSAAHVIDRT